MFMQICPVGRTTWHSYGYTYLTDFHKKLFMKFDVMQLITSWL